MQLTMFEQSAGSLPVLSNGKTCPESLAPKITPSVASLLNLPGNQCRSNLQGGGATGQTLVLSLDPAEQSHGGSLMPNISAWPNDARVCLLSQVLERGLIPQKYFLSSTACAGILRRAAKRNKALPPMLDAALRQQARSTQEQEQEQEASPGPMGQPADTLSPAGGMGGG